MRTLSLTATYNSFNTVTIDRNSLALAAAAEPIIPVLVADEEPLLLAEDW